MKRIGIFLLMLVIGTSAIAQSKKKKKSKSKQESTTAQQPSSVNPYYPKEDYVPTKKKKSKGRITYDAQADFYKRMEMIAKEEVKAEKEAKKPENSDPLYFGHKKPPKKRPPGKMKYCKVCGIKH